MSAQDAMYMARALFLARKGLYTTDPNPRVGCVIVKNDTIIGEGWHVKAGLPHAEPNALKNAPDAKGATAYVTLEPCSHHGRTPPCCDALINAGISRVVVAMQDPNPLVAGQGLKKLQKAGIDVTCGVLQQDAELLNRGFIRRMTLHRPFVRSKLAMSLDGRTALASGESKWITSPESRADVQRLRAESSAILTGINTVLADDPTLNARVDFDVEQPIRIILDSHLRMPLNAQILKAAGRCLILTCSQDKSKHQALEQAGFEVFYFESKNNRPDLAAVMTFLAEQQINNLWVEAGPTLNGALLSEQLIDEIIIYMASVVLGDQGRGLFSLPALRSMADKKTLLFTDVRSVGSDIKLTLTPH